MGLNLKKKAQDLPQETEQKPRSRKAKSRKKSGPGLNKRDLLVTPE